MARFRQTGTQTSAAANWATANEGLWYNSTEKPSPLVTHGVAGTPSVSTFTLNAPGTWRIDVSHKFSSNCTLWICTSNANGTALAGNGPVSYNSVSITKEFNYASTIVIRKALVTAGTMDQGDPMNFVTFTYEGAI
jgi:hypothetical protein